MSRHLKLCSVYALCVIGLTSCGGGSGGSTPTPPSTRDTTAPRLSFSQATLTLDSGSTAEVTLSATDNVGVTSGPSVTCTNGGSFSNNVFTAPSVSSQTQSVCTATASDAAGNQGTATLTVTITPAGPKTVTLNGIVHKGIVSNATISLHDAANGINNNAALVTGKTLADGSYSLTIPEGTQLSDMLYVKANLADANMVCDGLRCPNGFGSTFAVPSDTNNPLHMFAVVKTPALGTSEANVNFFTNYQYLNMIYLAGQRAETGQVYEFTPEDYSRSRSNTAKLFALPNADFYAIPFVDITDTIVSSDQTAIYAALVAGGYLDAAYEAPSASTMIYNLETDLRYAHFIAREREDSNWLLSVQDIFENAIAISNTIDNSSNVYASVKDALIKRLGDINRSTPNTDVLSDGSLPTSSNTDIKFYDGTMYFGTSSKIVTHQMFVNNLDELPFTVVLEAGQDTGYFQIDPEYQAPNFFNLITDGAPEGIYTLKFTFDTGDGTPNTETVELKLEGPGLDIVEDELTISAPNGYKADLTLSNPNDEQGLEIYLTGENKDNFSMQISASEEIITLSFKGSVIAPTEYDVQFSLGLYNGSSIIDTVKVTVAP